MQPTIKNRQRRYKDSRREQEEQRTQTLLTLVIHSKDPELPRA